MKYVKGTEETSKLLLSLSFMLLLLLLLLLLLIPLSIIIVHFQSMYMFLWGHTVVEGLLQAGWSQVRLPLVSLESS